MRVRDPSGSKGMVHMLRGTLLLFLMHPGSGTGQRFDGSLPVSVRAKGALGFLYSNPQGSMSRTGVVYLTGHVDPAGDSSEKQGS